MNQRQTNIATKNQQTLKYNCSSLKREMGLFIRLMHHIIVIITIMIVIGILYHLIVCLVAIYSLTYSLYVSRPHSNFGFFVLAQSESVWQVISIFTVCKLFINPTGI